MTSLPRGPMGRLTRHTITTLRHRLLPDQTPTGGGSGRTPPDRLPPPTAGAGPGGAGVGASAVASRRALAEVRALPVPAGALTDRLTETP